METFRVAGSVPEQGSKGFSDLRRGGLGNSGGWPSFRGKRPRFSSTYISSWCGEMQRRKGPLSPGGGGGPDKTMVCLRTCNDFLESTRWADGTECAKCGGKHA